MATDLKASLDALNLQLEANDVAQRVEFSKPATPREVAAAEKRLGVKLPPSYVAFVTTHGPFFLSGDLTGRGDGNDTKLFTPVELSTATLRYRAELAKSGDTESQEVLDDGLLFCADPLDEFFHLFVVSSKAADGEMKTRGYDYQDPANSGPWEEGSGTFESVVGELLTAVRSELGLAVPAAKKIVAKAKATKPAAKKVAAKRKPVAKKLKR